MYSENLKCPGGPHLSSSYDDYVDYYGSVNKKPKSPAYGFEKFCNMSGLYTFYVATSVPTVDISICAIAVFGTRFIRDKPLKSAIEIKINSSSLLSIPHVHAEHKIGNQIAIDIRQKAGSELSFITLKNGISSTDVAINTTGLTPGEYNLVLESFDSAFEALALKTDSIKIIVVKPKGYSDTLAYFITILEQIKIIPGISE